MPAQKSDITIEVLAALKMGSAGIVNEKEYAAQIQKQANALIRGVSVGPKEGITLDPKFKISPQALAKAEKDIVRQIQVMQKGIDAKLAGTEKITPALLKGVLPTDYQTRNAAKQLSVLQSDQIKGLQNIQKESLNVLRTRQEFEQLSKRQLKTLGSDPTARKYPEDFNKAAAASERFAGALKQLNKAASAPGMSVLSKTFGEAGPKGEKEAPLRTTLRTIGASLSELSALETKLTAVARKARALQREGIGLDKPATGAQLTKAAKERDRVAQLAAGRESFRTYGKATAIPPAQLASAIAFQQEQLAKAQRKSSYLTGAGEAQAAEKRYGQRIEELTTSLATMRTRLKEFAAATNEATKASNAAAAAASRRARGTDVSKITDVSALRGLQKDVSGGLPPVTAGLQRLRAAPQTPDTQSAIRGYEAERKAIIASNDAIQKRIGVLKEAETQRKRNIKLLEEARMKEQELARAATQAVAQGTGGLGRDVGTQSEYARRRKAIDDYRKALNAAITAEDTRTKRGRENIRALERQKKAFDQASASLNKYQKEIKESAAAQRRLATGMRDTERSAGGLRDRLGETGLLLRQFFRYALGYGALYKAIAGVSALTRGVIELDKELKSIQAISAATDEQMVSVAASIKGVATETKFTVAEVAKSARVLAQAGVDPEQINAALKSVSLFAAGTETAISTAADVVSTMRNVFKELDDIQIADKLTKAINISKLTGEDLRVVLSISAQIGKSFELSSDQYLAAVATLRNAGLKASTVATGLRQGLLEIFNPDTKSLKALSERYLQIGEALNPREIINRFQSFRQQANPLVAALQELDRLGFTGEGRKTFARAFDIRAENAISALINNLDGLQEAEARISLGGAAAEASAKQLESLSASVDNLGAAMTVLASGITEGPVAALEDLVDWATESVKALTDLDQSLKTVGATGAGGVGISALAGGAAGAALTPGKALARVGGGLIGAGAAGTAAYQQLEGADSQEEARTAESALNVMNVMLTLLGVLSLFGNKIPSLSRLKGGGGAIKRLLGGVKDTITLVWGFFSHLGTIGTGIKLILTRIGPIGWITTIGTAIYAIYEFFRDTSQSAEDLAKQTEAIKKRTVQEQQRLQEEAQAFSQFQLSDKGAGLQAATGSSAEKLETSILQLQSARQALSDEFFGEADNIDQFASMLEGLVSGPAAQANSQARREQLQLIENTVNARLAEAGKKSRVEFTNLTAEQDRFLSEISNIYVGSMKSIAAIGKGNIDYLKRIAGKSDKSKAEQAFADELDKALAANPTLQAALQGDEKALARIGGIDKMAEAIAELYQAISYHGQSVDEQVEAGLEIYGREIAALMEQVRVGLTSGSTTHGEALLVLQGEIDKLSNSGVGAAEGIALFISETRLKMDKLRKEIEGAQAVVDTPISPYQRLFGIGTGAREEAIQAAEGGRAQLPVLEQALANAESRQQQLYTQADKANADTAARLETLYKQIQTEGVLLREDPGAKTQLAQSAPIVRAMVEAVKEGNKDLFLQLAKATDARTSAVLGKPVEVATRDTKALERLIGGAISRSQAATEAETATIAQTKFAADPRINLEIYKLDTEIKNLKRLKSPELFGKDSPIYKRRDLLIKQTDLEIAEVNENLRKLRETRGDYANFQKIQVLKKKNVDLQIKRSKIEEEANQAVDAARAAYDKQRVATEKELAEANKALVEERIAQGLRRDTTEDLRAAQEERLEINLELLDLEKQSMELAGKDADLIKKTIDLKERQIRQQEISQRADEAISFSQEKLYGVQATPTTGSPVQDARYKATGREFTDVDKVRLLTQSLKAYTDQLRALEQVAYQSEGDPEALKKINAEMDILGVNIAEVEGQLSDLQTTGSEQLARAFDTQRILTDFQNLSSALKNLGDTTRQSLVGAFDQVGGIIVESIDSGSSALEALQNLFHDTFLDIAKNTANTFMNQLYQQMLGASTAEGGSLIGNFFSQAGGAPGAAPEVQATTALTASNYELIRALQANTVAQQSPANALPGLVGEGAIEGETVLDQGLAGVTEAVTGVVEEQEAATEASAGFFASLGNTFMSGFQSFTGFFSGLFQSIFGGGGGATQQAGGLIAQAALSYFSSGAARHGFARIGYAGGAAGMGSQQGTLSPGGKVSGPGIGDSIAAALFGARGVRPIAIQSGESLLNRGATSLLGDSFINNINKMGIRGYASGGIFADKDKASPAPSFSPNVEVNSPTKIVNVVDKELMHDYAMSSQNEKVVLNIIRRNPRTVRDYARG